MADAADMQEDPGFRLLTFKNVSLLFVIVFGVWALVPPAKEDAPKSTPAGRTNVDPAKKKRQHQLRMSPGIYMPGTIPGNVGKKLEGLADIAEAFEKLFPDTYIDFAAVPYRREYMVTQLSAAQAPDIFSVNVEDVWPDAQKNWWIPLDQFLERPNPFIAPGAPGSEQWWDVFKYEGISRGKADPTGKMFCITLDMVETGIFYNKDVFRKVGVEEPRNWQELLELSRKLKDAGYIPLQVAIDSIADWGFDLIFDQFYAQLLPGIDLMQDPKREVYLQGYLDWQEIAILHEKGFFTPRDPRWVETWRQIKNWRRYFPKDLAIADPTKNFITQKAAMWWQSSGLVNVVARDPDMEFEYGVFYLPPMTKATSKYADGHPMCVIGGAAAQLNVSNSALNDTPADMPFEQRIAESERLRRVIAFLQFLTTPENNPKVVNEPLMFLPNVKGVEARPELAVFHEILQRRYTTTKFLFTFELRFKEVTRRMLQLYLEDDIEEEEYLKWIERNLSSSIDLMIQRKGFPEREALEKRWEELAPMRATYEDLPDASKK